MTAWGSSLQETPDDSAIAEWEMADLLESLLDKNLIVFSSETGRFRMLETVRDYGRSLLNDRTEAAAMRGRHLAHFLSFAEEAEPHLTGQGQREWLDRLEAEHENLRTVMDYCTGNPECAEAGFRLAGSLGRFWMMRGGVTEGRIRCAGILKSSSPLAPSLSLAKALHAAGNLAYIQSDLIEAKQFYKQAAAMRHDIGDLAGEAGSLGNLATVAQTEGDIEFARHQFERSLAILQDLGQSHGIAVSLGCLGSVAQSQGDLVASRDYFARALALNRKMGDRAAEANTLNNLGNIDRATGNEQAARLAFERALKINRELGYGWEAALNLVNLAHSARLDGKYDTARTSLHEAMETMMEVGARKDIVSCLEEFAALEASLERAEKAARLLGAASVMRKNIGFAHTAINELAGEQLLARLKEILGNARLAEVSKEGRAMTQEDAIAYALQDSQDG